jgi:NAD(P)-dependent dehydrogenase (short-subunit alcohol dehydrogenase family)
MSTRPWPLHNQPNKAQSTAGANSKLDRSLEQGQLAYVDERQENCRVQERGVSQGASYLKRNAIITGYSSGLGLALTNILLADQWNIVGVARRTRAEELLTLFPSRLVHIGGSVADDLTVDAAFEASATQGGANLLINCAGQGVFGSIGTYSSKDIGNAIEGNLHGLMLFSDRAVRHMRSAGGDIVNVISTAAKKNRPLESVYSAAKWGAKAYTKSLREAVKAQNLNIRVFEIYPCGMKTQFWDQATRPVSCANDFPGPEGIAQNIYLAISSSAEQYCNELAFERSQMLF